MQIKIVQVEVKGPDWYLEETSLDNFNLLVGVSGVGKTKIIRSLQEIFRVATGKPLQEVISWKIGFLHNGQEYEWELHSSKGEPSYERAEDDSDKKPVIVYEKIVNTANNKPLVLLERSKQSNVLDGKAIPKLKKTESAIIVIFILICTFCLNQNFPNFRINRMNLLLTLRRAQLFRE